MNKNIKRLFALSALFTFHTVAMDYDPHDITLILNDARSPEAGELTDIMKGMQGEGDFKNIDNDRIIEKYKARKKETGCNPELLKKISKKYIMVLKK